MLFYLQLKENGEVYLWRDLKVSQLYVNSLYSMPQMVKGALC